MSELEEEYRMRCLHYVREEAQPVTYAEFRELDPDNMTDLERVLWGQIRMPRLYCQDYWSEPLSAQNAHKRNNSYWNECYRGLWYSRENYLQYEDYRWDQHSRIANWLDIPGDDLLEMSPRPLDLVVIAWERERGGYEPEPEDEWYGILRAWPIADDYYMVNFREGRNSDADECVYYYPQLFTGAGYHWTRRSLDRRCRRVGASLLRLQCLPKCGDGSVRKTGLFSGGTERLPLGVMSQRNYHVTHSAKSRCTQCIV